MAVPAIIVKMNNRDKKNQLVKACKIRRIKGADIGLNPSLPIFIKEQLTKNTKEILNRAYQLKEESVHTFVWCRYGNVFVKEGSTSKTYKITNIRQLQMEPYSPTTQAKDKDQSKVKEITGVDKSSKGTNLKRTADERSPEQHQNFKEKPLKKIAPNRPNLSSHHQMMSGQGTLDIFKVSKQKSSPVGNNSLRNNVNLNNSYKKL